MLHAKSFAFRSSDTDEVRLEKSTIFLVAASCCIAGCFWTLMYAFVFGWVLPTFLPLLFLVVVGSSLVASHISKNHYYAVYAQIICIVYITSFIQWSIGGVFDSGFVMVWAFCGPIVALIFFPLRKSFVWLALYLASVLITVLFDSTFASHGYNVADSTRLIFFAMNLGVSSLVVFLFASHFVAAAAIERRRADAVLLNTMPSEIVSRLKSGEQTIADHFDSASVLFADVVGSTPLFAGMTPEAVVDWLNEVFSMFDHLVEKHGLEKIQTIGDGYMVAAGVPVQMSGHAQACTTLALEMNDGLKGLAPRNGQQMAFRFGIHSGPLVAGVIGERKFQYNLFGDTVNTASRMESHGEVGHVHVSDDTHTLIQNEFDCISRGLQLIKGKGEMETWFVVGRKLS